MTGAADALNGLLSLVGAGGFTSIAIAYLAYKAEAAKGRRQPLDPDTLTLANGPFPGAHDFELLAHALGLHTAALVRSNHLAEFRLGPVRGQKFRAWLEEREMRDAFDQLKHGNRPEPG